MSQVPRSDGANGGGGADSDILEVVRMIKVQGEGRLLTTLSLLVWAMDRMGNSLGIHTCFQYQVLRATLQALRQHSADPI